MLLPICPLFLAYYYKYIYFFFAINKRKKWVFGHNTQKTQEIRQKLLAIFNFKSGQLAKKSGQKSFFSHKLALKILSKMATKPTF